MFTFVPIYMFTFVPIWFPESRATSGLRRPLRGFIRKKDKSIKIRIFIFHRSMIGDLRKIIRVLLACYWPGSGPTAGNWRTWNTVKYGAPTSGRQWDYWERTFYRPTASIKPTTLPSCQTDGFCRVYGKQTTAAKQRIARCKQYHHQRTVGWGERSSGFIPAADYCKPSWPCQIRKEWPI